MRLNNFKPCLFAFVATVLILGASTARGRAQTVKLSAGPASVSLPDGKTVPMWSYTCGTATGTASCAALNPNAGSGWSPVLITVAIPAGQSTAQLTVELANHLSFATSGAPNNIPTSLTIVGQLGGGLGSNPSYVASPAHSTQGTTWPIANAGASFTPPAQPNRVQSFATEVAAGSSSSLVWSSLRPGTYLIESGTHPSIQGPMGLYGILVVTTPPAGGTQGTAYPNVSYDADVPMLLSEIDPVQNAAVGAAVNTAGFSETAVWSGQAGGCGNAASPTYNTCYPPAVNYSPLYYLVNGVSLNKSNTANSTFPVSFAAATGQVLVRFVNAGLHMHVPAIVGATTGASATPGMSLIAEDGNPLPGLSRVQSEVFLAAGKTYDAMLSEPVAAAALPVFDRQLSLSANNNRDSGMQAYIGINGGAAPKPNHTAIANPDSYFVVGSNALTVSDRSKGVLANDVNVATVALASGPAAGTIALNADGTFTYTPTGTFAGDAFRYCANGTTTICATVTLATAVIESNSGVHLVNDAYTSNVATTLSIKRPGILANDYDDAGYPLSVVASSVAVAKGLTVTVAADGSFTASATTPGTYSFSYNAQNSQGTQAAAPANVQVTFPAPSNLAVTVKDPQSGATISDYRWIIEEDRTFHIDPATQTNTASSGQSYSGSNPVPSLGTNFHTSYMPVVAEGCVGTLACESGQTLLGQAAVCDVGNGACRTTAAQQTATDPGQVVLNPNKRYYISILPGDAANPFIGGNVSDNCINGSPDTSGTAPSSTSCGHTMGGAPIGPSQQAVTVYVEPAPLPTAKVSVVVFEDDNPLNGEQDAGGGVDVLAPDEPGLGNFEIRLFDAAGGTGDTVGQITYDMFNMPITNSLAGMIDPSNGNDACPISAQVTAGIAAGGGTSGTNTQQGITGVVVTCPYYESDNATPSPLAGQAIVANLYPGRYVAQANPGADRIARGEEWLQTNTLDGQKGHDAFIKVGGPAYFQEYGPSGYHDVIGFANPAIINSRLASVQAGAALGASIGNTIQGQVTTIRLSRTPDERMYSSGSRDSFAFTQCYVSLGDPDGADFEFVKCDENGNFKFTGVPDGDWRITLFDQWNDQLLDGLSVPAAVSGGKLLNMGQVPVQQWQPNLYTRTYFDLNGDGVSQASEPGLALAPINVHFRDGSFSNLNSTDLNGYAAYNETFPLFNWYVLAADTVRYKQTGVHVVMDAGGPADGSGFCGDGANGDPPKCGNSTIAQFLANTAEQIHLPANLRFPGAEYCANADCTDITKAGTKPGTAAGVAASAAPANTSTARIDPPWVSMEGWQEFPGQNMFIEFGKKPYAVGENGGIAGDVVYASTRPFDDPQLLVQNSWEPQVPGVTVNLYEEGAGPDGTQTLTLIDTTKTSSWDDWAQGFRTDGVPNMNCPGQTTTDPFYFSLYNTPQYLDWYNVTYNGGGSTTALPDNGQFKCYDGMHNWNQLQPAPFDGHFEFPSVTSRDPVTGQPTGSNCIKCVQNTATDASDPYYNTNMLPAGKYVVEVVVPPGYELVKEEDKNILIGDNFIAAPTQEFGSLGNVFILPDQAAIASAYNANNAQNSTNSLGSDSTVVTSDAALQTRTFWPCVGQARVVPDYISLYPGSKEVAPFAGATRNLCDRKEITLVDQTSAQAQFFIFSSTHIASHFTGVITDDFSSEFDPFAPSFGEKFSPPNMPVSIKDWTGREINRVYADNWGLYDGLNYSTWEVNPPNPAGYAPTMMVVCMNDSGPVPDPNNAGQTILDPLFNPGYSQFCYELPFMPGQTGYFDTPVVPTAAFSEGYNHPDCSYPDVTPAVKEVDGDLGAGTGPWVAGIGGSVASAAVSNGGSGYTSAPSVTFAAPPAGGTTATGTAIVSGAVTAVNVTASGSGYSQAPTVVFTGGGGSGAAATATVSGSVSTVRISNGGAGYSSAPTVIFSAPASGTRATGTATINRTTRVVTAVDITNGGTGYTSAPTVTFSGGGASRQATATDTVTLGVTGVTLANGGTGYTSAPQVSFSGGAGFGARASASIVESVTGVNIVNAGAGYTTAPAIAFSGGGGSGAQASATLYTGGVLTITALGTQAVLNNAYSGPGALGAPFNAKTIHRTYSFGNTQGTVTIGGLNAPVVSGQWSDNQIKVLAPAGLPPCATTHSAALNAAQAVAAFGSCGELVITAANGKQSVDAVTVTVGGKKPKLIAGENASNNAIQAAIDAASPGDLLMVEAGYYKEMAILWKPVRLQGVGAASTILDGTPQPSGKLDPWRRQILCLFGMAADGVPITPMPGIPLNGATPNPFDPSNTYTCPANQQMQVDRIPLEGIVGWETDLNGNLAQLLQEPTLMGAYEGAGVTVLAKGVRVPAGVNPFSGGTAIEGDFPTGTVMLTNSAQDCNTGANGIGGAGYQGNFLCAPSRIDGLTITDSSQGGGGIFLHGWTHYLEIANNRILNNAGTLSGGISVGQGEVGDPNVDVNNVQLPYGLQEYVHVHNNSIVGNTSYGDELFSATPAAAGGVTFNNGSDWYQFDHNWLCGNMSSGDGGGLDHLGFIYDGKIDHNYILFNQSSNPTIQTNGGGIAISGSAPDGVTATGQECGNTVLDADCPPGLSEGAGPGLTIDANLIVGNAAESGSGGGIRLQLVNGTEVSTFPTNPGQWYGVTVTNNIIANNVAGWDGAGVSLQDALKVQFVNNTVASNDTTASSGVLFNTIGAPLASAPPPGCDPNNLTASTQNGCPAVTKSTPQPAGLVTMANTSNLLASLPRFGLVCPAGNSSGAGLTRAVVDGDCRHISYPFIANDLFWQNRDFNIQVGSYSGAVQQNIVTLVPTLSQTYTGQCVNGANYWDIGVRGDTGPANHAGYTNPLTPIDSILTDASTDYSGNNNLGSNPLVVSQYCNGARVPPENTGNPNGYQVPPGISDAQVPNPIFNLTPAATVDEGNNWINIQWGPLSLTNAAITGTNGDYGSGPVLGDYDPTTASPAVAAASHAYAPATDFYGKTRYATPTIGAVEIVPPPSVSPRSLSFGSVAVNTTSAQQTLTLTNVAGTLTYSISIPAPFAVGTGSTCNTTPAGGTLAANGQCTINVVFKPTTPGAATGTVAITGNQAVLGSPVALTGSGVSPSASLTPTSYTFSATTRNCPGTTLLQKLACAGDPTYTYTLKNTGTVTLTNIAQATLGGTNTGDFAVVNLPLATCGSVGQTTLAPGATCSVVVQFKPLTSDPANSLRSATVSVTDSAGTQSATVQGAAR